MLGTRFEEYSEYEDKLPFKFTAQIERTAAIFSTEANWHEDIEIELCLKGEGYVLLNGERINISKGDTVVVNSDVLHYTATDSRIVYACLIVSSEFCRNAGIDTSRLIFKEYLHSEYFEELFCEMTELYNSNDKCRTAKLQILTLRLLTELCENHVLVLNESTDHVYSYKKVRQVIKYIRENYDKKISLEMISKSVCLNKYSIAKDFKAATGQTVFQYLNNYRCNMVVEHIKEGMSVNEAARVCGFNNMSYFAKTFKNLKGVLPSECKKRM